jgi:hypothetical protein
MATRQLNRLAVAATLHMLLVAVPCAAQPAPGNKPAIDVKIAIVAQSLAALPQRSFVEREVAKGIASRFRDHYRLFAWGPAPAPVATLMARVTQTAAQPLPTIDLDWVLQVPGQADFVLPIAQQPIYDSSDMNRALHEPDGFRNDLERAVREVLKEGFFDRFRDEVVQRIPIARAAKAIPEDRMIAVPLLWNEAQLSHEAVVRVLFERREGDAVKRGHLDLDVLNERSRAPEKGMVQGGVQSATWDTGQLELAARWNPQLPLLLDGASIWCHITKYKEGLGESSLGPLQLTP